MGKYPIYAIVAIVFVGIIKLLQVTAFNVEQYNKNKKLSFAKPEDKSEIPYKKESTSDIPKADSISVQSGAASQMEEDSAPPVLEREEKIEGGFEQPDTETTNNDSFESTENEPSDYTGLEDLKNSYLTPKIADLPPGQLREDVVIRYYRHEQDGDKIYSLRDLGYYIHEKKANETAGLGSNVLYYGNDVNIEDIQIVAYTLLDKGLPIKSIAPTRFSWKSNSIEIGTDTLLINEQTLSKEEIRSFKK